MDSEQAIEARVAACELEDHLQSFQFHVNGFNPAYTSALGTYMGILRYDRILAAFQALPDLRKWELAAEVWEHDFRATGSPTFNILALEIRRLVAKANQDTCETGKD